MFQAIHKVTQKYISQPTQTPAPTSTKQQTCHSTRRYLEQQQPEHIWTHSDPDTLIPTRARNTSVAKIDNEETQQAEGIDALAFLRDWATTTQSPPYCALLGEYGMGKTTTCKAFARTLLEQHKENSQVPLPIYLDLRHLGEQAKNQPELSTILSTVIKKSWQGGEEHDIDPQEIIRLVQEEGAVIIFDGLDEVLVHLSTSEGQRFTRELWRCLPTKLFDKKQTDPQQVTKKRGKLLVSCRTHYFRTLRDQKTHLTGEDRDQVSADNYRALILLPFNEDQIEDYLRRSLPDQNIEQLLELIRSIHNLPEMAERPYTLSLIAQHIPELEHWKMSGKTVTGVTLYRHMVQSWLERDAGKHQLDKEHKPQLMEHFAAELWRSGQRSWSIDDLEKWFISYLASNSQIRDELSLYPKNPELLKEDLRTATFLVRQGENQFRFAHSSLQEHFLAAYLKRALDEVQTERWQMAIPSRETLNFLGQLLVEDDASPQHPAMQTLDEIRKHYQAHVSELALKYSLLAYEHNYPMQSLADFDLRGAQLNEWHFIGKKDAPPLNLHGVRFDDAQLRQTKFHHTNLNQASFKQADLTCAEFIDGMAQSSDYSDSELTGVIFRDMDLSRAQFDRASHHRSQWLRCRLENTHGLPPHTKVDKQFALTQGKLNTPKHKPNALSKVRSFCGHTDCVTSAAFSHDGRRIVSASDDNTLRLWDANTGEQIGYRFIHLPEGETATISADESEIIYASDGAWRWLGWLIPNPDTGALERYPAEVFGELPSDKDK